MEEVGHFFLKFDHLVHIPFFPAYSLSYILVIAWIQKDVNILCINKYSNNDCSVADTGSAISRGEVQA